MAEYKPDKTRFKDEKGRYIVQGLFLEDRYNTDLSTYTFDGEDKKYKGKVYPSLKRLYLELGDPTEYAFARMYLYDWPHWKRLCKNAVVGRHIEDWRDELALSLRADGISTMIDLATNQDSYQAAKFLSDEGWIRLAKGRPSKAQVEGAAQRKAEVAKEFQGDLAKLEDYRKGK